MRLYQATNDSIKRDEIAGAYDPGMLTKQPV
jgi:hypothetical protein